jgi:predicted RNase H-like nuclease
VGWRLAALEASYGHFIERANGDEPGRRPIGQDPPVPALLEAASKICRRRMVLIAVDMPLARHPIAGRRRCDNEISRAYGAKGAAVHSPSAMRPGKLSDGLREAFEALDHGLCVKPPARGLIEVYPHAGLIEFLHAPRRLEYKAAKISRYWPKLSCDDRRVKLRSVWTCIVEELERRIGGVAEALPPPEAKAPRWGLKAFEDKLDAVVCCAVAIACLEGKAMACGDQDAAIWVPIADG